MAACLAGYRVQSFPSDIRAFGFRIPVHIVVRVDPQTLGCSRDGRRRAWCEWKLVYPIIVARVRRKVSTTDRTHARTGPDFPDTIARHTSSSTQSHAKQQHTNATQTHFTCL